MKAEAKVKLLERRLQVLESNGKDNQGVCRRIRRDIRKLSREADRQPESRENE